MARQHRLADRLHLDRPNPISARGAFHTSAADGVVAVTIANAARARDAQTTLDAVVAAHERVADRRVPKVVQRATTGVAFACKARRDLAGLLIDRRGARLPFAAYAALIDDVVRALLAAHSAGVAVGALAFPSVLIDDAGRVNLITLGKNLAVVREDGTIGAGSNRLAAPEVLAGAEPTASADTFALVALSRALLPYANTPADVDDARGGRASRSAAFVAWESSAIVGAPPAERASLAEWRDRATALCADLGVEHDRSALASGRAVGSSISAAGGVIAIAADGSAFRGEDGRDVAIPARSPLRRIVAGLAARLVEGGPPCTALELGELGWPGERPSHEASTNRVYVAIATLRKLGLRSAILRSDQGYCFDRRLPLRVL